MAHEVVSERFHNSQIENDMNYKNSHSMISLLFVLWGDEVHVDLQQIICQQVGSFFK